ncbi:MAG TPA: NUDIX hydrolase [Patescibacteria group bacterium]|nr:NUDIX hydrolase [Patescibacteria group bacterium]
MYLGASFPPILAVAGVVVNTSGKILLRKRTKHIDQGKWQLFAGYVEPGERLADAMTRILREKADITGVQSIEFSGRYYDDPKRHPGTHCIPLVFRVKVSDDTLQNLKENDNMRWFSAEEARELEYALDNRQILLDMELI